MKYPQILSIAPEPGTFAYDEDFAILYALALGAGSRPEELRFVYEKQLRALPTMAVDWLAWALISRMESERRSTAPATSSAFAIACSAEPTAFPALSPLRAAVAVIASDTAVSAVVC